MILDPKSWSSSFEFANMRSLSDGLSMDAESYKFSTITLSSIKSITIDMFPF